ncbi:MAG: hypothetical protein ISR72_07640 [Methylobacter sp.]|nr:hypothetical protein [Methylobacter sp.]
MPELQELSDVEIFFSAFNLIFKRIEFYVLVVLSILFLIYISHSNEHTFSNELSTKLTSDFIGLILDLSTLLVVFSVWIYGVKKEWTESLNKLLSVQFVVSVPLPDNSASINKLQIECLYAPLSGDSDVRQMAQALGKSVNGECFLPIAPMLNKISKKIKIDSSSIINNGIPFMSYEVEIKLTETLTELKRVIGDPIPLADNEYIYWAYPFDTIKEGVNKKRHQA